MRPTLPSSNPLRRRRRDHDPLVPADADVHAPWSTRWIVSESDRVFRRLQQLEAGPWWRVSGRELDELDARLAALRAHAAQMPRA